MGGNSTVSFIVTTTRVIKTNQSCLKISLVKSRCLFQTYVPYPLPCTLGPPSLKGSVSPHSGSCSFVPRKSPGQGGDASPWGQSRRVLCWAGLAPWVSSSGQARPRGTLPAAAGPRIRKGTRWGGGVLHAKQPRRSVSPNAEGHLTESHLSPGRRWEEEGLPESPGAGTTVRADRGPAAWARKVSQQGPPGDQGRQLRASSLGRPEAPEVS